MTAITMTQTNTAQTISTLNAVMNKLQLWADRSAQRKQLLTLDDAQLEDMGLTLKQAKAEAKVAFWH